MKPGKPGTAAAAPPPGEAPRAWVLAARACLAAAFAGWIALTAGYANHQELLANTAHGNVSLADPGPLLDRISSWSLLHDAEYFARYAATLDPRNPRAFQKFWVLSAVEVVGLGAGLAATTWPTRWPPARLLASALLCVAQAAEAPEAAVETVYNYRARGVRLPAYRVATIIGSAVVPLANLGAAMVLGWDPVGPGPDAVAVAVPDPRDRGVPPWQAWLERTYLGMDRVRRRVLLSLACFQWVATAVGFTGYAIGVGSGTWWRTHVPLCGTALFAQAVANLAFAAALDRRTRGRATGVAQAAQGCALVITLWRVNRSWAAGLTMVAIRAGAHPPPGYICWNAGAIAFVASSGMAMHTMGTRAPQKGDTEFRGTFYRAASLFVAAPLALAGNLLLTIATLVFSTAESERRMWAGERAYSQSGDRWWLVYSVTIYTLLASKPFLHGSPLVFARSREAIIFGNVISALGSTYMVATSNNSAVNAAIWLLDSGLLTEAFLTAAAHDGPGGVRQAVARAVGGWRRRARAGARAAAAAPRLALVASAAALPAAADPEGGRAGAASEAGGRRTVRLLLPPPRPSSTRLLQGRPSPSPADDVVLHRLIGTGSFASVFRGTYGGGAVAVKVLCAASPETQAAAREEARLALSLRHPCVLQTFAVLDVDVDGLALLADSAAATAAASSDGGSSRGPPAPLPPAPAAGTTAALAEFAAVLGATRSGGRGEGGHDLYDPLGGAPSLSPSPSAGFFDRTTSDETAVTGLSSSAASGGALSVLPPPPARRQTWIVTELGCGTLDRAICTGAFDRGAGVAAVAAAGRGKASTPGPPPSPRAALLATLHDIASGLAYLHAVGIVHGDVKPANVLLRPRVRDRAGRRFSACLSDFGLSRVLAPGAGGGPPSAPPPTHTFTHTFGTAVYVSPEMMKEGRLSRASDCYALAMVMWEGWAGVPPYEHLPAAAVFWAVGVNGSRPDLDGFGGAPAGFVDLMTALWDDDPSARPTAAEAAGRLAAMLDAELGQRR